LQNHLVSFLFFIIKHNPIFIISRDEVLTRNKFLEEEARRKAEAVEKGEDFPPLSQQELPQQLQDSTTVKQLKISTVPNDSHEEDDIFYDSDLEQAEE
jgi:CTP:phosphocholine cytidylyltransferase-like protein